MQTGFFCDKLSSRQKALLVINYSIVLLLFATLITGEQLCSLLPEA